jgi:hypothetical protein
MQPLHYMVWRKNGGRKPRKRHATLDAAQTEALRLIDKYPGIKFQVLAVMGEYISAPQAEEGKD